MLPSSTQIRPKADPDVHVGKELRPERILLATPADVRLVRHYRRLGVAMLKLWGLSASDDLDVVTLLISELVTNAIKHGSGLIQFDMSYVEADGLVVIDVDDGSPQRPVLLRADPEREDGRGMALVDALSKTWTASEDGRRTRCEIAVGEVQL